MMIAAAVALVGFSYHPEHDQCTPIEPGDQPWVVRRLENAFAGTTVARKGVLIDASILPGFVATDGGRLVGLLTYAAASRECEVVALISTEEGRGIGRGLMDAVRDYAEAAGYRRLWLITTNDNTRAIRFYQGWGWTYVASTATACDARGRSSLRSLNEVPTVSRLSTSSSSRCSLVTRFAPRCLCGKAGPFRKRMGKKTV
jgi:GNAT superfamily N-acetyltransferase